MCQHLARKLDDKHSTSLQKQGSTEESLQRVSFHLHFDYFTNSNIQKTLRANLPCALNYIFLQQISLTSQPSDSGLSEECAALRLHKSRVDNEISRLKTQLKSAESANAKWQVSYYASHLFCIVQISLT